MVAANAVSVVDGKLMMKVMKPLTVSKQRGEPIVSCRMTRRIRLFTEIVADRIDRKRHVLVDDKPQEPCNKQSTQRISPERRDPRGKSEADKRGQRQIEPMLKPHHRVTPKILALATRIFGRLEEEPENVRVPKPFFDVVRIFVTVDVLVVPTMVDTPFPHRTFETPPPLDRGSCLREMEALWLKLLREICNAK